MTNNTSISLVDQYIRRCVCYEPVIMIENEKRSLLCFTDTSIFMVGCKS